MAWYSELARRILPRPTPTPAGDKPPRYIFSFRHRPSVYNSARFAGGEPASRLIGGHIFVRKTNVWVRRRTRKPFKRIFRTNSISNNYELVGGGFGQPDFAGPAQNLSHVAWSAGQIEDRELLGLRVESDDCVCAEVAQPNRVVLVHIHRIGPGAVSRELPFIPVAGRGIVGGHLSGVPFADPNAAQGIGHTRRAP